MTATAPRATPYMLGSGALLLTLAMGCATPGAEPAAAGREPRPRGIEAGDLDRSVDPCTDAFEKRGQCVLEQYEGYFIEPGLHHQGKLVLDEAIADLAGVRLAYRALQRSMRRHPVPVIDGFTHEQQFFIVWGQLRGEAMRTEAQRQAIASDPHPVARFRVEGPLVNSPEFHRAFSCPAGAQMVRPPEQRCEVW